MSVHDTKEQIEAVKRFSENELLKAAGVKMAYTQEQIDEYERCKNDANYFISNYYKIITLDDGYKLINPHNFQRKMIRVSTGENRFVIAKIGRQFGKCFSLNTSVAVRRRDSGETYVLTGHQLYTWLKFLKGELRLPSLPNSIPIKEEIGEVL